jgi:hypothetical protein
MPCPTFRLGWNTGFLVPGARGGCLYLSWWRENLLDARGTGRGDAPHLPESIDRVRAALVTFGHDVDTAVAEGQCVTPGRFPLVCKGFPLVETGGR